MIRALQSYELQRILFNKIFNAKKMLMSTLAAAVFSFVFTTSANAAPKSERPPKSNLEIRGKDAQEAIDNFLDDVFGIRVKIRVK